VNYDLLRKEIQRDEGVKLVCYKDSLGFWTIGCGHLLGGSPRMSNITEDEMLALLTWDLQTAEAGARRLVPGFDALTDEQQRALVNMTFNRGEQRMRDSSKILPAILAASNGGDWHEVRGAIAGSQWASQVGERATRIAEQFDPTA
jgi:lysozyme